MIRLVHWALACLIAVVLHGVVFALAAGRSTADMERSAGQPGAVWGLAVESIAETVEPVPANAASEAVEADADAVDQSETVEEIEPVEVAAVEPVSETATAEPVETPTVIEPDAPVEAATATSADRADDVLSEPVWTGGIAVAPAPETESGEVAEEIAVAALPPVPEPEEIEVEEAAAPMPKARPDDLPQSEPARKPAPSKTVARPQPQRQQKSSVVPAPSRSGSSAPSAAPAGEQAGTGGVRQADGGRQLVSSYAGRVASHLQRFKRYPADAEDRRLSGTATITFTLGSDGRVRTARLSRSSGLAVFDSEVLAMVDRAAPFPPIPPAIGKGAMTFTVPVNFRPR